MHMHTCTCTHTHTRSRTHTHTHAHALSQKGHAGKQAPVELPKGGFGSSANGQLEVVKDEES